MLCFCPQSFKAVRQIVNSENDRFVFWEIYNQYYFFSRQASNETNQMASIIENLVLDSPENRGKFLEFVKGQSPWMYEELVTETRAEMKELDVDDYEIDDASFLIHRHFGSSKRFSEFDKKTMTLLVATKSQVAKEVWGRRLSDSNRELEETRKLLEERDKLVRKTNDMIKTFIRRNERELHDFARAKSTTQILTSSNDKSQGQTLDELIKRTDFLIERFERALFDKEAIFQQRQECMSILDVDDFSIPIYTLVKQTIDKLTSENETGKNSMKSLKAKTIQLEEELNRRDIQLEKLRAEIETLKQKNTRKQKVEPTQLASKSSAGRKQVDKSPENDVSKSEGVFPALEKQAKPKYCPRPREANTKTMPLHGRSYLLDVGFS